jgi:hypothetical protein
MKRLCCLFLSASLTSIAAAQAPAPPLVKEGKTVKLSEHVFVIPDELVPMVPNVGIVVASAPRWWWIPAWACAAEKSC